MSSTTGSQKSTLPKVTIEGEDIDLSDLRVEFDQADEFTRKVQAFKKKASVPAQNELRNAGYHILYAISDKESSTDDQLIKAINHCRRASYEAAEAGVIACLILINVFKDDYKDVVISEVVPNWSDILVSCKDCQDKLSASRQKGDDRSVDYKIHMEAFDQLSKYCILLDAARDDLNKKIKIQVSGSRRFIINCSLVICTIVVSIALAIIFSN